MDKEVKEEEALSLSAAPSPTPPLASHLRPPHVFSPSRAWLHRLATPTVLRCRRQVLRFTTPTMPRAGKTCATTI
ncbi:hypothetical protein E2C01_018361 [Portunus trituberculatus]|uniref:Uncharacterized protein n=1 Tax=Portunus trituberculatus TaxID=210409 RepID=A0A5B7DW89_PORTR|nr:hypothetical protein [Portunus trituberculatus]